MQKVWSVEGSFRYANTATLGVVEGSAFSFMLNLFNLREKGGFAVCLSAGFRGGKHLEGEAEIKMNVLH